MSCTALSQERYKSFSSAMKTEAAVMRFCPTGVFGHTEPHTLPWFQTGSRCPRSCHTRTVGRPASPCHSTISGCNPGTPLPWDPWNKDLQQNKCRESWSSCMSVTAKEWWFGHTDREWIPASPPTGCVSLSLSQTYPLWASISSTIKAVKKPTSQVCHKVAQNIHEKCNTVTAIILHGTHNMEDTLDNV